MEESQLLKFKGFNISVFPFILYENTVAFERRLSRLVDNIVTYNPRKVEVVSDPIVSPTPDFFDHFFGDYDFSERETELNEILRYTAVNIS